jgi:hypothetical protein
MSGKKKAAAPAPVQMDIIRAIESPLVFRPLFKDLGTWASWMTYLRGLFGLGIEGEAARRLFEECTGLAKPPTAQARESFVICGRRSGKSFISAIIASYLAAFKDWRPYLAPGEAGWIFVIATDKAQAGIIKAYIAGIFHRVPTLKKMVARETQEFLELRNGVNVAVKQASFRSLRGYTVLCAILEELAFYRSSEDSSCNPDREILAAVRPALATVPGSLLIGISTPYSRAGVLFDMWRTYYGQPGGPLIFKAPTATMNPTIDKDLIARAIAEDPQAAAAEWQAEWRQDIEAFISQELVQSVIIPGRFELPRIKGVQYYAFADPSGGRQDSFTLGIAHNEKSGKVVLDLLRERRPPFQPKGVVEEFSDLLKSYGLTEVVSDRYAAQYNVEAFQLCGISVRASDLSASELYLEALPLIANGTAELLDNKRLAAQLAGLERRTRAGGKDLVTHYAGGHDDAAVAASGALVLASKNEAAGPAIGTVARSVFPDDYNDERELAFGSRHHSPPPMDGFREWAKKNPR